MKLITEMSEDIQVHLVEATSTGGKKQFVIEGIFLQGSIPNRNGRRYPQDVLESEVNRYVSEKVSKNRAYGELGHPAGPQINLERVSHIITDLKREGNNYLGKATITEGTPYGAIVKGLLESGANLGVSSRGLGSLREGRDGIMEVQTDFRLATAADIVADPSAPDAFVKGIMEGVEWVCQNGVWKQSSIDEARVTINRSIKTKKSAVREEVAIKLFERFMKTL